MNFQNVDLDKQKKTSLDIYQSNTDRLLPGIVIIAGGSYKKFAERDSERVALTFATHAFQSFVVRYPVEELKNYQDAKVSIEQSFDYIVSHAKDLGVDTEKLGIIGFSAGGQLAAAYADKNDTKAKFAILGYPVTTQSLDKQMGVVTEDVTKLVTSKTPKTFIFGSINDQMTPFAENILPYVQALAKNNVKFELHEFSTGNHGISLANTYTRIVNKDRADKYFAKWFPLALDWLDAEGLLTK